MSDKEGAFRAPWSLFWVGLVIRLGWVVLGHTYRFPPYADHFSFAWEAGHIARALATGCGYADPFLGHTGPTAWLAPAYPLMLAAIFKLFGVFTPAAGCGVLATGCVANATVARMVWEIGARSFNLRVATWAAWIWVLLPSAMQYAVRFPWETAISACLFTWMLVVTLRLAEQSNSLRWAGWGLLWGAIALFNPALLAFLPFAGIWLLIKTPAPLRQRLAGAGLAAALCIALLGPWWVRNERVFHAFIPLRSNAGVEFCLGNCYGIQGSLMEWEHPFLDPAELDAYRSKGELRYSADKMAQARAAIRAKPGQFVEMCLLRMDYYWFGVPHGVDRPLKDLERKLGFSFVSVAGMLGGWLAWKRRRPAAGLYLLALLAVPAPYYMVIVWARFRHPLEPILAVLGVYLFQSAGESGKQ